MAASRPPRHWSPEESGSRQSDEYVYVTQRYGLACAYAHRSGGTGDPVVLLVQPHGEIEPDPECSDSEYAYRCEAALVVYVAAPWVSAEAAEKGWQRQPGPDLNPYVVKVKKDI